MCWSFASKNSLPPSDFCGQQTVKRAETVHSTNAYWINHGDDTANRDYWFFGWLLQRQVTKQLQSAAKYFTRPRRSRSAPPTRSSPSLPPDSTSALFMISTIITTCSYPPAQVSRMRLKPIYSHGTWAIKSQGHEARALRCQPTLIN
jgi:hypothetical protein